MQQHVRHHDKSCKGVVTLYCLWSQQLVNVPILCSCGLRSHRRICTHHGATCNMSDISFPASPVVRLQDCCAWAVVCALFCEMRLDNARGVHDSMRRGVGRMGLQQCLQLGAYAVMA